jgi:hypothetical protein
VEFSLSTSSVQAHGSDTCIMSLSYLPPIAFYQLMLKHKKVIFDIHENFHKQFYFNRCSIYGANGALKLSVPIKRNHKRTALKDVSIFYEQNWKTIHWRSIEAAYRRSPFFEYYEEDFRNIYLGGQVEKLMDWNLKLLGLVNKLLDVQIDISFTESYEKVHENIDDYRTLNVPKAESVPALKEIKYRQVFEEKYGFIPNLSTIDLLFCEGHYARQMLLG